VTENEEADPQKPEGFRERLAKYVELAEAKKTHKEQAEIFSKQMSAMESDLMDEMAEAGQQSIKMASGATVFLHRQIWAKAADGDTESMVAALKANEEWAWLVEEKVNSQKISARVRELEQDADGMPLLPADLVGAIAVTDVHSLRVRKS
jgi:hypothetical protein